MFFVTCIIEKYNSIDNTFSGRTYAFAPDDIDGEVIIENNKGYTADIIGQIMKIKVIDADFYDLKAEFE